jgi:hypothetical protein
MPYFFLEVGHRHPLFIGKHHAPLPPGPMPVCSCLALLFKQQLTTFLEKIYGMTRDDLKKEISPLLDLFIHVGITGI